MEGFGTASVWAAGILAVGALIVAALIHTPRPQEQVIEDAQSADPLPAHS